MKTLLLAAIGIIGFALIGCQKNTQVNNTINQCGAYAPRGAALHWAGPQTVYIHESVPVTVIAPILAAAATWNAALGFQAITVSLVPDVGPLESKKDGQNVIYWTKHWQGSHIQQAVTRLYFNDVGLLVDSDILVNPKVEGFAALDIQSLMVHEFGHFLGLAHQVDVHSIMYPSLRPFQVRQDLTDEDYYNINCIYGN